MYLYEKQMSCKGERKVIEYLTSYSVTIKEREYEDIRTF